MDADLFELAARAIEATAPGGSLAAQITGDGAWQASAVTVDRGRLIPLPTIAPSLGRALADFVQGALQRRADGAALLADLAAGMIKLVLLVLPAKRLAALDAVPVAVPDGETRH